MIEAIPAIDLLGGKCVRLMQGDYAQSTTYHDDPVSMARHWVGLGAKRLHIVDLDAARSGEPSGNQRIIARIAKAVPVPVQTGGGIRTRDDLARVFESGVKSAILGTAAVRDPDLVAEALEQFGSDRIIVGIDAKGGEVRLEGWIAGSGRRAADVALAMELRGVRRIIYTDISRDGTLAGPNVAAYSTMLTALSRARITASGGIAAKDDLAPLEALGIDSAIVGRALYEGTIDARSLWPQT